MRSLRLVLAGLVVAALYDGSPAYAQFFEPRYEPPPPRYQQRAPQRQRAYPPGYIPPSERQYVNPRRQYVPPQQQEAARPRVGFFQRLFPRLGLPAPRWPSGGQQPQQAPQQQYVDAPSAPRPAAPKKPVVQQTTFVAVIGNSLAENLANGLVEALSERPEVGLVREIRPGVGFLKETDKPWRDVIDEIFLREKPVTAAVIMMGPHDDPPKKPDPDQANTSASGGAWMDLYAAKVDDVILSFRQRNIPILWVALPPVADPKTSTDYAFANELVQQRLQSLGGIFIDVWEGFVDDDEQFMTQGPNLEGRTVRLRMADGVHFTKAGSAKLAHYVELELRGYLTTKDDANTDAEIAKEISAPLAPGSSRILLLGEAPRTPGAVLVPLAPAAPAQALPDVELAQKAMRDGEVVPSKPGRGDDFSWTEATAPDATVTPVAN